MKKNSIRYITLGIVFSTVMLLTGCGEQMKTFLNTDLNAAMEQRITDNEMIAGQLRDANFISTNTYDKLIETLEKQKAKYRSEIDGMTDIDTASGSPLLKGIAKYSTIDSREIHEMWGDYITDDDGKDMPIWWQEGDTQYFYTADNDIMKGYSIVDYLVYQQNMWEAPSDYKVDKSPKSIEPLVLIDDDIAGEINEKFDYDVYVLSPTIMTGTGDGSIDGIMELLKSSITQGEKGTTITNIGTLNNYFVKAVDENGEPIKLISSTKNDQGDFEMPDEYKIIQDSKEQELNGNKAEPGYDLIVKQWNVPTFSLRFTEFNTEAYQNLSDLLGMNSNKYVFYQKGDTKAVYLMEYTVSVLTELVNKESTVEGVFENSGLGINLYTGKLIKYDKDTANNKWLASGKEVTEAVDLYLTTDGASSNDESGKSAFIVKGMTNTNISYSLKTNEVDRVIGCGRIILRDYLEATYAPGFEGTGTESVAAFGRKIRLHFNNWIESDYNSSGTRKQYTPTWTKGDVAATFVDKDGNKVVNSPELEITDFCDAEALSNKDYTQAKLVTLPEKGAAENTTSKSVSDSSIPKISELPHEVIKTSIKPTLMFPGETMGISDYTSDSEQKQRFYCLTTNKGLFDSALFSSWINSTASTASLDWWNQYLGDNKFLYNVSHEAVNGYLSNNYKYELNESGIIVLDLEVVAKIQEQYDKEGAQGRVKYIRTFFMVLGWFLICYSAILLLAWAIDTNSDIGIKLLEKFTSGHWVAIKYQEDVPYYNTNEISYLTGDKILIKCLILITVGILLIWVNVFEIVLALINLFGMLATELEKIIKGVS